MKASAVILWMQPFPTGSAELRREKTSRGLKNKHAAGVLSDNELKAIREALSVPSARARLGKNRIATA